MRVMLKTFLRVCNGMSHSLVLIGKVNLQFDLDFKEDQLMIPKALKHKRFSRIEKHQSLQMRSMLNDQNCRKVEQSSSLNESDCRQKYYFKCRAIKDTVRLSVEKNLVQFLWSKGASPPF